MNHSKCLLSLLFWVVFGLRLGLCFCRFRRRNGVLLVCSSLQDVLVVSFLHEELSKMVLAVEDSIKRSIGTMGKRAAAMGAPEA